MFLHKCKGVAVLYASEVYWLRVEYCTAWVCTWDTSRPRWGYLCIQIQNTQSAACFHIHTCFLRHLYLSLSLLSLTIISPETFFSEKMVDTNNSTLENMQKSGRAELWLICLISCKRAFLWMLTKNLIIMWFWWGLKKKKKAGGSWLFVFVIGKISCAV